MKILCQQALDVLVEESNVQRVSAPVTICARSSRLSDARCALGASSVSPISCPVLPASLVCALSRAVPPTQACSRRPCPPRKRFLTARTRTRAVHLRRRLLPNAVCLRLRSCGPQTVHLASDTRLVHNLTVSLYVGAWTQIQHVMAAWGTASTWTTACSPICSPICLRASTSALTSLHACRRRHSRSVLGHGRAVQGRGRVPLDELSLHGRLC